MKIKIILFWIKRLGFLFSLAIIDQIFHHADIFRQFLNQNFLQIEIAMHQIMLVTMCERSGNLNYVADDALDVELGHRFI